MKSSMRTSPGWIGAILSVIVNDLHLLRSGVRPYEADPPLVVDPDAALTGTVAFQCFEPGARRDTEVVEHLRRSHLTKLAQRDPMDPRIDRTHTLAMPQSLGVRSEEHTSELQSRGHLVCRLLLEQNERTSQGLG